MGVYVYIYIHTHIWRQAGHQRGAREEDTWLNTVFGIGPERTLASKPASKLLYPLSPFNIGTALPRAAHTCLSLLGVCSGYTSMVHTCLSLLGVCTYAYVSLTTWCVLGVYGNREMPVSHPRSRVDTGWTAATAVLLAYTAVHKRLPVLLQCLALDCVHIAANVQMRWMCAVTRSKGRLSQCCETSAPGGGMMLLREPDEDACARVCVRQSRDTAC